MATIDEAFQIAVNYCQSGQFQQAEQVCWQILQVAPDHAEALHLLGILAHQDGQEDRAVEFMERAIVLDGSQPHFYNDLGELYRRQGRTAEAAAGFRRAIELQPDYGEAHYNLGNLLAASGGMDEAIACYRRAVRSRPDYAEARNNLGNALASQGSLDEAATWYRGAIQSRPEFAEAHHNLGNVLAQRGSLDEAIACYHRAVQVRPDYAEAHSSLGNALAGRNDLPAAIACYRRAIELKPDDADVYINLGVACRQAGNLDEAIACYRRAIELRPGYAEAYSNLAIALGNQGNLEEQAACQRQAMELGRDDARAQNTLANALALEGRLEEAIACFRRAIALKPDYAAAHSSLLGMLQFQSGVTLRELNAAHAEYQRRHAAAFRSAWRPHENSRDPERPLRLGFVSADFWQHPVGYFLVRVLENLDRQACQTACYSDRRAPDRMTARLRAAATLWRDTAGLTDDRLAEQIRADRIDVLMDMAGHTTGNRLLVFARKPAPIQVTWAGYVGTTGLAAMDYLLADRWQVPPEAEPHYAERILRMPDGYVCYDPPACMPPVGPLPALASGQVTFGSLNYPAKIGARVVACWAAILRRIPSSRLILKYRGWEDVSRRQRLLSLFDKEGVPADRLDVLGGSTHDEFLSCYHRIDIALDPFPYSGGLTTCEALWMGVPVVTCPGETFASRHSLSHLSNVGLTETIARDLDEYVELAVSLAGDFPRLAEMRAGLRERMARSPLCDGKRFAENLMRILRQAWREFIEASGQAVDSPDTTWSHRG